MSATARITYLAFIAALLAVAAVLAAKYGAHLTAMHFHGHAARLAGPRMHYHG
jgi:hypothetical protein